MHLLLKWRSLVLALVAGAAFVPLASAAATLPFERDGKSRKISLDGPVMVNDMDLAVRAAVDGLGIAYTIEALADRFLRSGQLVRVLEDWSPFSDGLFLYYPGHQ